jgi:hypothetical protein
MNDCLLREGAGFFVFSYRAAEAHRAMRVFYSYPQSAVRDAPIIIAMHGIDRAAAEFRDAMASQCARNGQIVLVPEFDTRQFPDFHAYNFGGVRLPPPSNTVLPREHWNFGIIDRLFEHVRGSIGSNRRSFGLFGNSAGAQYVLRYLALTEAPAVDAAVAANCGVYMLPDLADRHLRSYLRRRLVILLGDADSDPSAPDLPRMDYAMAQGPHRLARGLWYFERCTKLADSLGVHLGWTLEIARGTGHVGQQIYNQGADILKR